MKRLRWLPLIAIAGLVSVAAATLLFSTFMVYDDEGYVLLSLKNFAESGGLYARVYSQYGPFFYVWHQALHFAGLQFTNTDGRLLTFIYWMGATALCAVIVWRATRSIVATTATLAAAFLHLWTMTSEPSHPGGLIVFLTALIGWLGVQWADQPRRFAIALGAIGAALVLTKINVGLFLVAAAGAWWALHLDDARCPLRWRLAIVIAALALLPVALMKALLDHAWVATFALVATTGGVTVALAAARGARPLTRWRDLAWGAGAAAIVTALTLGAVIAQGTTPGELLEGVLLGPLRHPLVYTAAFNWERGAVAVAVVSFALAAWVALAPSPRNLALVMLARILVTVGYFLSFPAHFDHFVLNYGLATAWVFVQPLGGDAGTQRARTWLALAGGLQALHAFPVAGSQISWGTLLYVPLLAIGLHDLVRLRAGGPQPLVRGLRLVLGATLLMAMIARCADYAWVGLARVSHSDSLRLPGAELLRLPESFATGLRVLANNASAHAEVLFSLPGLESFQLWTGLPTPTLANTTHWFNLLTPAQQEEIRARLAAAPRSCVIVQRNVYDFLRATGVNTTSPLSRWLLANYEPAFAIETYEFWVRKGRHIAALDTAAVTESPDPGQPRYRVSLTLAAGALKKISAIEFARFNSDGHTTLKTWTAADTPLVLTSINSTGAPIGPERRVTFPFDADGLVRVDLLVNDLPIATPLKYCVLFLRDATGAVVAESRFVQ